MTAVLVREDTDERIVIDAMPSYTVSPSAQITAHPIERGSEISDHRQILQTAVTMRCKATESPTDDAQYGLPSGPARVQAYIDWLDATGAGLVTMLSPDRPSVGGLMIRAYPQSFDATAGMDFTIELVQVRIVDTETAELPTMRAPKAAVKAGAATEADKGEAPTTEVTTGSLAYRFGFG